jgi:hypothetical protein
MNGAGAALNASNQFGSTVLAVTRQHTLNTSSATQNARVAIGGEVAVTHP